MKHLFSGFAEERNAAGQLVIDFGAPLGVHLLGFLIVPAAGVGFAAWSMPRGLPWYVPAIAAAFSLLGVLLLLFVFGPRTSARVTIDRAAGKLAVESAGSRDELPLKDVLRAELASETVRSSSSDGETTTSTVTRLELVLRSGERVGATRAYFSGFSDAKKALAAINRELGATGT
jgi:hypothetical protein